MKWISVDAIKHTSNSDPEITKIYVSYHFSRRRIRNGYWQQVFTQFDQNWEEYELAKDFKIYEADGNGITSLSLGVQVDLGSVKPEFNLDYKISAQRDNLFKTTYQRNIFLNENDQNLNHGFKDGVPIRHVNGLYWTMPTIDIAL